MIQSTIEALGVFTFVCLAALVVIPLLAYVFQFWFGFFRTVRTARDAIRKLRDAAKDLREGRKHEGTEEKTHDPTA